VSLRFILHPKEKDATDEQGVHGTTSGGYDNRVGDLEAGRVA